MSDKDLFEERYKSHDIPWDNDVADFNLVSLFQKKQITARKILEVGCGTGQNSRWLAQNGFKVTATDFSSTAIKMAKEKAEQEGVNITYLENDFLKERVKGHPFDFIFDRGCFHSFDDKDQRRLFAENAAFHLSHKGKWFSLMGNCDEKREGKGPPQRSVTEIASAVEPFFEIQFIASGFFHSTQETPAKAWICLMQKR